LPGAPLFIERFMTSERQILEGFLRGDATACRELLTRLRPACLAKLLRDYPQLRHVHDEILDAAEMLLFEWRSKHLAGEKRLDLDEPLQSLARRLVKQEAEKESIYSGHNVVGSKAVSKKVLKKLSVPAESEDQLVVDDLVQGIDELPEEMAAVLIAEAQRVLNDGPPLAEQLGVTPEAARKRLERARRELKLKLWGRKDEA